jgi:hypothetical protein
MVSGTPYTSATGRLAFGRETSLGKFATPDRFFGITHQAVELPDVSVEPLPYNSFGSTGTAPAGGTVAIRKRATVLQGRKERKRSITYLPTTAEPFYYAFGVDDFTPGSPNIHVMYPAAIAVPPSRTLAAANPGSPNFQRLFMGYVVDGLRVQLSEARELQVTEDYMARVARAYDLPAPTLLPSIATQASIRAGARPYMFYDRQANVTLGGTYDYSANSISGGRSIARVRSFDWSIRNQAKAHHFSNNGDRTQLTGTVTVTNGSAVVTGVGTTFTTDLFAGAHVLFQQDAGFSLKLYTVQSVDSDTQITLTANAGSGSAGAGQWVSRMDTDNAQDPYQFTWGTPEFDLTLQVTPAGKTSADVDAVYDLIENGTKGDCLIPFWRGASDRLDFVFSQCIFAEGPHGWREDGNEITVDLRVVPEEIRVVARDTLGQYSLLV